MNDEEWDELDDQDGQTGHDPAEGAELALPDAEEVHAEVIDRDPGHIDVMVTRIEDDPDLGESIAANEMDGKIYKRGPLPWDDDPGTRRWTETDFSHLRARIQTYYGLHTRDGVADALNIVADANSFDPLRDRFDALPEWDGRGRAGHLMHWYLGAEANAANYEIERMLLSAVIQRVYEPGKKFDYMPVLMGRQGIGKSTFCSRLALEDEYFTDDLTNIGTKEAKEGLQGVLVAEVSELASMRGRQRETVKAFLSRQSDDYREAYGRDSVRHPRRCVLIGTTNESEFLTDPTGNRRFIPVKCGVVEPVGSLWDDSCREWFEQAYAEILHYYREGTPLPLVLTASTAAEVDSRCADAMEDDPVVGVIGHYLKDFEVGDRVCAKQIQEEALDDTDRKFTGPKKIHQIMRRDFSGDWREEEVKKDCGNWGKQRCYRRTRKEEGGEEEKA